MKFKNLLTESYECIKIGGILRNLSNDEMKIYKRVKDAGKVFKQELSEYEANVATTMVSKGLLRRKKAQQDEGHGRIYYVARGRKGHLVSKEITEVAPPGKESEKWIRKNKKRFKDKYGKDYEKYLYGKAWNNYNGKKKIKESAGDSAPDILSVAEATNDLFQKVMEKVRPNNNSSWAGLDGEIVDLRNKLNSLVQYRKKPGYEFITDLSQQFDSADETLRQAVQDAAADSGDYNTYYDDEYNSEATHDEIAERDLFGEIMREHMSNSTNIRIFTEFKKEASDILSEIDNQQEPEFDGDFDTLTVQQSQQPQELSRDDRYNLEDATRLKEIIKIADQAIALLQQSGNRRDRIIEKSFDDILTLSRDMNYSSSEMDRSYDYAKEQVFDYVDNNMAGDTDYSFIHMDEGEYDSDATWDKIYEEDMDQLIESYGTIRMYRNFIDELKDTWDEFMLEIREKNNKMAQEDEESDGSEYDE